MTGRLIERGGARPGTVHLLGAGVTTIGRGDENAIAIANAHVSLRHASVTWDGARYVIEDLGSTNGTCVNGRRLAGPHELQAGDLITLAGLPELAFLFSVSEKTEPVAPTSPSGADEGLRVDLRTAEVFVAGRPVNLTAKEYLAVALLYEQAGALVGKETLAQRVWPEYGGAVSDENIGQLISRLRQKLEPDPAHPRYLLTVRGLGYRLVAS